ncbi:MAG TPA: amidohydrolase family protein [Novosphingobium sp.]
MAPRLPRAADEIDGQGGTLLPGLHDHHLHLLALAARVQSVELRGLLDPAEIGRRLVASDAPYIRATDYDERAAGLLDAALLDRWVSDRPLRVQDRTGALWVLNSAALEALAGHELPLGAERDDSGVPTGRFWREDHWLGRAIPRVVPDLSALGARLAGYGLTGLTDAGACNGPEEAATLALGGLSQRLTLMGREALTAGEGYALGPLKLLLDERDLPSLATVAESVTVARRQGRNVAAHCVTDGELAYFLAVLDLAGGARQGDRVEHGGIISPALMQMVAACGLVVVTNPAFLYDRGDRYLAEVQEIEDLYRIGSLQQAGIKVLAGSDAPYAAVDPWLGMRAARDRLTAGGHCLAPDERITARKALDLYCAGAIGIGQPADLIVCAGTFADVLGDLDQGRVRLTFCAGALSSVTA